MRFARTPAPFAQPGAVLALAAALTGMVGCAGGDMPAATSFNPGPGSLGDSGEDDGSGSEDPTDVDSGGDETEGEGNGICLLHNCESDLECGGCTEGRTMCLLEEKRCIACEPGTTDSCADGEVCSEFGYCVPAGLTCPTDPEGVPSINCLVDDDCAACDPQHLVCDTSTNTCVGCSDDNVEHCQTTEHCSSAGECIADCPESCTEDSDCSQCGGAMTPAHACVAHQCAQCGDDVPCPDGQVCNAHGVCVDSCGLPGMTPGTCDEDSQCAGCAGDSTNCNTPINGGHGTCGPEAAGCSDLGQGVVVLPEPFDEVTNLCSDDGDCAGIGIDYNVGELLRDITGLDQIGDAIIEYPMGRCAEVSVGIGEGSISCGVCVPCEVDNDCQDIDIDEVAGDAFGPLGAIATALLLDELFGLEEHRIYMFCQPVGAGYGVCAPCPTLVNDCAGDGGSGGGGSCDHDVCEAGGPLQPSCGACAADVCNVDPYCCEQGWDDTCIGEVEDFCAGGCDGGGGGGACGHDECTTGAALDESCSTCTSAVCAADPFCCQTEWDDICVGEVETECGEDCGSGGGGCLHDECSQGGPLVSTCSPCVSDVCSQDDFCCSTDWDAQCVDEADQICGGICGGGGGGGCAHDECQQGGPLEADCSSCVSDVCDYDPFCCASSWDGTCIDEADEICGGICGGGGGGFGCAHDECVQGGPLEYGCSDCATAVCDYDSVCCDSTWDDVCVDEASQICGC